MKPSLQTSLPCTLTLQVEIIPLIDIYQISLISEDSFVSTEKNAAAFQHRVLSKLAVDLKTLKKVVLEFMKSCLEVYHVRVRTCSHNTPR